jgi:hypothetical protein
MVGPTTRTAPALVHPHAYSAITTSTATVATTAKPYTNKKETKRNKNI